MGLYLAMSPGLYLEIITAALSSNVEKGFYLAIIGAALSSNIAHVLSRNYKRNFI